MGDSNLVSTHGYRYPIESGYLPAPNLLAMFAIYVNTISSIILWNGGGEVFQNLKKKKLQGKHMINQCVISLKK